MAISSDQRIAGGRRVDGVHEELGVGVLLEEAAGAGAQGAGPIATRVALRAWRTALVGASCANR